MTALFIALACLSVLILTLILTTLASLNWKIGRLVDIHTQIERHVASLANTAREEFIEDFTRPYTADGDELLRNIRGGSN